MGVVIENRWWGSLKYRIRDSAIKFDRKLKQHRAKMARSFDDKLSRAVERIDFLAIDLAKNNLSLPRFPHRYIEFVKSSRVLRSSRDIYEAFWVNFHDYFAHLPKLPVQEFRIYLADFPHLQKAKEACSEGLVVECCVCDELKHVGLNKSLGLDGLPNEDVVRLF